MPTLTLDALRAQLAREPLRPVYLVIGDDERGKAEVVDVFVSAVPEDVQAFALERVSALDADAGAVVASARTPPLIGDRRVVIVTRAERWFVGRRRKADGEEAPVEDKPEAAGDLAPLEAYLELPDPLATVVFVAEDVNRTLRTVKALLKQATIVECWGLKEEKEVKGPAIGSALDRGGKLAASILQKAGLTIDRRAVQPLVEHAGTDIGVLRGALDRLVLYCHGRKEVTLDDVKAVVGAAALVDDWAMVNAIERGNAREALRQLHLLIEDGGPYRTLGQLAWFVRSRLAPNAPLDRARQLVDAVFQTDLAIKTSGGEPQVLLERLVVELCAASGRPGGRGGYEPRREGGWQP
jgi:DNA polymerase-3 subunit delta